MSYRNLLITKIKKIQNLGIRKSVKIVIERCVYPCIERIGMRCMSLLCKNRMEDTIVLESHNDFDSNGGAFYEYLLKNGYNKNYKIVWFLVNKTPDKLPENVFGVPLLKPNLKRWYYHNTAKYILSCHHTLGSVKEGQISVFMTHGAGGLKNVKGKIIIPDSVNYILLQSMTYAPIQAKQYSLEYPSKRLVSLGYPSFDILNGNNQDEIRKITNLHFDKKILWMPTFRKNFGGRIDGVKEQPLGIPLINNWGEYEKLNEYLKERNVLLIVKIHPMQDLSSLKATSISNISVLTGSDVKNKDIDNYRLMNCVDAMISDYSGAAFEFLQLNRPISYVLDDLDEYKLGFVVEDIHGLLAGAEIYSLEDMYSFINDVVNGEDPYKEKREKIRNYIYEYHDCNNCERLVEFIDL